MSTLDFDGDDGGDDSLSSVNDELEERSPGKKRQRVDKPAGSSSDSSRDARLIATATEEHLRLLNIDPNSKEGKRQRRKIRNKMSAQLHRERKKNYIDSLEEQVRERDAKIGQLQNKIRLLASENETLRAELDLPSSDSPSTCVFSSGTSSESDSETSSVVSSKDTKRFFGSGVSILSFFVMFGMTFWGFPDVQTSVSSSMSLTTLKSLQLSLPLPVDDGHSSVVPRVSRFLVEDSSSADEDNLSRDEKFDTPELPLVPLSPSILWNYEDRVAQLYPVQKLSGKKNPSPKHVNLQTNSTSSRGNLRGRESSKQNIADVLEVNQPSFSSSLSRIVVSHGKALLDPKLALWNHPAPQNVVHPYEAASSNSMVPITASQEMRALTLSSESTVNSDVPMLMMLLPASVIRFGNSWESDNNTPQEKSFQNFMRDHINENETSTDEDHSSQLWVEIGCSVFKAQLVSRSIFMNEPLSIAISSLLFLSNNFLCYRYTQVRNVTLYESKL